MKILLLSNLFVPYTRGGAERIVELQADMLANAGHEVVVVTTSPDGSIPESRLDSGVNVYRFRTRNIYHSLKDTHQPFWKRLIWHWWDLHCRYPQLLVKSVIKKEEPDVIVTHNMKGFGLCAFRAIAKSGVPHVHYLHDLQLIVPSGLKIFGSENSLLVSGPFQKGYVKQVKGVVGSPDLVLSPSKYLLAEHVSAGLFPESKKEVFPNPSPWGILETSVKNSDRPVILYVGQLEVHKGLQVLMDAWSDRFDADLEIVGSG
ncbi:MAG: glycosyltransferase, partial [bacterium]|nr:glycosyltransferase [bacterium]